MESQVLIAIVGALQTVVLAVIALVQRSHLAQIKMYGQSFQRLLKSLDDSGKQIADIKTQIAVHNEKLTTHDATMVHNFNQVRTALARPDQCQFDPTQAEDVHDAAKATLRLSAGK